MAAKLLNFPKKEELTANKRERMKKNDFPEAIPNAEAFNKLLSERESDKEMFTPDYFLLVE